MRSKGRRVIVASNRGPVSFDRDNSGRLVDRRGAGGLVTAVSVALGSTGGLWIAAAMSEEDRTQAGKNLEAGSPGATYSLRLLAFEPHDYEAFYDGISNRVLWFVHHSLWDIPRQPTFEDLDASWAGFRAVNEGFAEALAEEERSAPGRGVCLVQDYHLSLVPQLVRDRAPDAAIVHFSHVPFAGPTGFRVLPEAIRSGVLRGMLGADVVGFQTPDWAENFLLCCRALPEAEVDLRGAVVRRAGRAVPVRVYPISVDAAGLQEEAGTPEAASSVEEIERWLGDQTLLLRVDRAELSKNLLRGFLAFERFLENNRDWLGRISFLALLNPSRQHLSEYESYTRECVELCERINRRLSQGDWAPIRLLLEDNHPRALAAYRLYDILLVNSVFDGMNLVAKEGAVLNQRDGVLILSENAGATTELGGHAVVVNPFDVEATARAIATAAEMSKEERRQRAAGLRGDVARNPIDEWVGNQLADLDRTRRLSASELG
jgi:trehalose 6-phosphate synthase